MDDRRLDALLTPKALSGQEREEMLERVLDQAVPRTRPRLGRRLAYMAIGIAACAGVALATNSWRGERRPFEPRGSAAPRATVELVCSGASLRACPRGSHLLFVVSGGEKVEYLAAYADPADGGERVWYFSGAQEATAVAEGEAQPKPLGLAIEIGPEHRVGRYVVHLLVASRPLSRAEALRPNPGTVLASNTVTMDVVP